MNSTDGYMHYIDEETLNIPTVFSSTTSPTYITSASTNYPTVFSSTTSTTYITSASTNYPTIHQHNRAERRKIMKKSGAFKKKNR